MSNYLLYGNKLIENDDSMKDFAKSICDRVPANNLKKDFFKEEFIDSVIEILEDDISRTDINYEVLMHKYRSEIGDLLYEIENQGCDMPLVKFFGEKAGESFKCLIPKYIDIHFDELVNPLK